MAWLYVGVCAQDGFGEFLELADRKLYWVSFLDGMQRVILFTEDIAIMTMAQQVSHQPDLLRCVCQV